MALGRLISGAAKLFGKGAKATGRGAKKATSGLGKYAAFDYLTSGGSGDAEASPQEKSGGLGKMVTGLASAPFRGGGGGANVVPSASGGGGGNEALIEENQDEQVQLEQTQIKLLEKILFAIQEENEGMASGAAGGGLLGAISGLAGGVLDYAMFNSLTKGGNAAKGTAAAAKGTAAAAKGTAAAAKGTAAAGRGLATAGRFMRGAGPIGAAIGVGLGAYEGYTDWNEAEEQLQAGQITEREANVEKSGAVGKGVGSAVGGIGGVAAGALLGGKIGAIAGTIVPGAGNIVGAIGGALIGGALGFFGAELGGYLGEELAETGADLLLDEESPEKAVEESLDEKVEEVEPIGNEQVEEFTDKLAEQSPQVQATEAIAEQEVPEKEDSTTSVLLDILKYTTPAGIVAELVLGGKDGITELVSDENKESTKQLGSIAKIAAFATNPIGAALTLLTKEMIDSSETVSDSADNTSELAEKASELIENNEQNETTAEASEKEQTTLQEESVAASKETERDIKELAEITQQQEEQMQQNMAKASNTPSPRTRRNASSPMQQSGISGYDLDLASSIDDLDGEFFKIVYTNYAANATFLERV